MWKSGGNYNERI